MSLSSPKRAVEWMIESLWFQSLPNGLQNMYQAYEEHLVKTPIRAQYATFEEYDNATTVWIAEFKRIHATIIGLESER